MADWPKAKEPTVEAVKIEESKVEDAKADMSAEPTVLKDPEVDEGRPQDKPAWPKGRPGRPGGPGQVR